jgi:hypothetical protein
LKPNVQNIVRALRKDGEKTTAPCLSYSKATVCPLMTQSGQWQCFIANFGVGCPGAAWWALTPVGRLRTIAITHQHLLLLALLLASPVVARAAQAAEETATVPRFEPAPCPNLQGAEALADASCGFLVVPEDRG